ncbi:GntR family transcriptional regulator, partial [Rhodococcus sp. 2H158]
MSRGPKTSLVVAQQIVRDTARKGLQPGDLLPPEKAMLEEYQIGRGTLRE